MILPITHDYSSVRIENPSDARMCIILHGIFHLYYVRIGLRWLGLARVLQMHENTRDRCAQVTGGKPARRGGRDIPQI